MEAVDQEEMDAIDNLKATNEIVSTSFKNDLLMLMNKHKALTTDYEQQKTQLIDALLSKDRLMKDLASFKERSGTNGDDAYQKAQSKAIIEEENARKALQDVSSGNSAPESPNPSKTGRGFWKALSRISFHPLIPMAQAVSHEPTPQIVQLPQASQELALQRERSASRSLRPTPGASSHPYTRPARPIGSAPPPVRGQADPETSDFALQRERAAIGSLAPMLLPAISPTHIPLPPSPCRLRFKRTDLSPSTAKSL